MTGNSTISVTHPPRIEIIYSYKGPEFLPVAHTCFNRLDISRYETFEILKSKLDYAIAESDGFFIA